MLPGLIYNECKLELAGIFMLENVNKIQHFEAFFIFLSIEMFDISSSPALRI